MGGGGSTSFSYVVSEAAACGAHVHVTYAMHCAHSSASQRAQCGIYEKNQGLNSHLFCPVFLCVCVFQAKEEAEEQQRLKVG